MNSLASGQPADCIDGCGSNSPKTKPILDKPIGNLLSRGQHFSTLSEDLSIAHCLPGLSNDQAAWLHLLHEVRKKKGGQI